MAKIKQYEWLDRTLVRSPFYICLCTTEDGFNKILKQLKLPKEQRPKFIEDDSIGACVHTFEKSNGSHACIVCIRKSKRPKEEVYPMLVHEAQHIFRFILEYIQETQPSLEFEAYSMQNISQNLFESYKRQISKKKGKK